MDLLKHYSFVVLSSFVPENFILKNYLFYIKKNTFILFFHHIIVLNIKVSKIQENKPVLHSVTLM